MSNPPPPAAAAAAEVDADVWRAIAGASVQIPSINSYVYYFPQGHLEHSSASVNYNITLKRPLILCEVLSVRFLSNPSSDQVFVKILLQPVHPHEQRARNNSENSNDDQNDVDSFAKILTPSDANNGGGFSVPRFCADSIFPRLDFAAEPPVQNLTMKDSHNNAWEFRHIYRGTPRRHLLTTGWSKFVNGKRLVAGDSAVFMRKKSTNELFIGLRRAVRFGGNNGWNSVENSANSNSREASEAIENAEKLTAFEVVYYPRVGLPDFVVSAEKVENALRMCWSAGMRVKMAVETEDSSRMTWFQGTVTASTSPDSGPWRGSPWRMLLITWDEPELLQNMNRVSPWQVEYVLPTPHLHSPFPPTKKFKVLQNPGMLPDDEGKFYVPMTELTHATVGHLNSAVFNYSPFPASMQGARRDQIYISSLSNCQSDNSYQTFTELLKNGGMEPELKSVPTILNIENSPLDNLSPSSQNSVHFCGTDLSGQQGRYSSTKVGANSFQLFGKIIKISEPIECSLNNKVRCTDGENNEVYKESNGFNNQPNPSASQTSAGVLVGLIINSKEPQL